MFRKVLHYLGPAVGLVVLTFALFELHVLLRNYHYRDLKATLEAIPRPRLILAGAAVAGSYFMLTLYDQIALRFIGRPIAYPRIALASFINYALNHNLGFGGLAGNAFRYRVYTSWGMSAIEVGKLVAFTWMTFWLGFLMVGGLSFLVDPIPIPAQLHAPVGSLRVVGIALLVPAFFFLAWSYFRTGPIRVGGLEIRLPSIGYCLAQSAVAALDWMFAIAALYLLLPASVHLNFTHLITVFLFAQIAGAISTVPGGIGVFEVVMLLILGVYSPPGSKLAITGSLVAFRALYYLIPLVFAVILLGVYELSARAEFLARTARVLGEWAGAIVPNLFSLVVFATGVVMLFSGATPAGFNRLRWLGDFLPLSVVEVSHFLGSIVGVALLILARGLQRRLDAAWMITMAMLGAGIILAILKGLGFEEATVLAITMIALLPSRRHFHRKAALTSEPLTLGWFGAIILTVLASIWLGFFSFKHVEYSSELWWRFGLHGEAPRFLRATVGAVTAALALGLWSLMRIAAHEPEPLAEEDWSRVREIVAASPRTYAFAALFRDKYMLLNETKTAFVMYGIEGRSWVALGDPVGPPGEGEELAWRFHEMANRHGGWTVFYHVVPKTLPLYVDMGLTLLKLGEEAMVPLPSFTIEGMTNRRMRQSYHHITREGLRLEFVPAAGVAPLLPELKAISDAWLREKNTREKGFSIGFFDPQYLESLPIAILRRNGRLIAFANLWPGAAGGEVSIDMMRYLPEEHGVMDYMLVELMLWGKQEGYEWFNLGMAPLSGFERHAAAPMWSRIGAAIYSHGEAFYNFQGLRQYKEKFNPVWVPKYLAAPGGIALPRVLANVATLIAGSVRGLVAK